MDRLKILRDRWKKLKEISKKESEKCDKINEWENPDQDK